MEKGKAGQKTDARLSKQRERRDGASKSGRRVVRELKEQLKGKENRIRTKAKWFKLYFSRSFS